MNERQWQTAADYSPGELPNKPMSSTQTNEKNSLMKIRFFVTVAGDGEGGAVAVLLYCCWWWWWCLCRTSLPFYVAKMVQILCVRKVRNVYRIWLPNVYGKINVTRSRGYWLLCGRENGRHLPLSYELSEHSQRYLWRVCMCVCACFVFVCFGLLLFPLPSSIRNLHFTRVAVLMLLLLLLRSLASWFINPNNIPPLQNPLYKSILQRRTGRIMARGFYYVLHFHHQEIMLCLFSSGRLSIYAKKLIVYYIGPMPCRRETFGVLIFFLNFAFCVWNFLMYRNKNGNYLDSTIIWNE